MVDEGNYRDIYSAVKEETNSFTKSSGYIKCKDKKVCDIVRDILSGYYNIIDWGVDDINDTPDGDIYVVLYNDSKDDSITEDLDLTEEYISGRYVYFSNPEEATEENIIKKYNNIYFEKIKSIEFIRDDSTLREDTSIYRTDDDVLFRVIIPKEIESESLIETIVKRDDGYYVKSEKKGKDGKRKNLGGPYPTLDKAKERLAQVEKFKHMNEELKEPELEEGYKIKWEYTNSRGRHLHGSDSRTFDSYSKADDELSSLLSSLEERGNTEVQGDVYEVVDEDWHGDGSDEIEKMTKSERDRTENFHNIMEVIYTIPKGKSSRSWVYPDIRFNGKYLDDGYSFSVSRELPNEEGLDLDSLKKLIFEKTGFDNISINSEVVDNTSQNKRYLPYRENITIIVKDNLKESFVEDDDNFNLHHSLKEDIPTFWEWVDDQGLDPDVIEENPDLEEWARQQYDITFNRNLKGKNYHVSVKYTNGNTNDVDMGYFYEDAEDYVDNLSKNPNVESIHLILNKTGKLQNVYNKATGWKKPLHSFILYDDIEESLDEDEFKLSPNYNPEGTPLGKGTGLGEDYYDEENEIMIYSCPNCGVNLEWLGTQGDLEEYKCPECHEYFYLDKEGNLKNSKELDEARELRESAKDKYQCLTVDYKLRAEFDTLEKAIDYAKTDRLVYEIYKNANLGWDYPVWERYPEKEITEDYDYEDLEAYVKHYMGEDDDVSLEDIWNEVFENEHDEDLANDVVARIEKYRENPYDPDHAEEFRERHPYGYYNNEDDYGVDESLREDLDSGEDIYTLETLPFTDAVDKLSELNSGDMVKWVVDGETVYYEKHKGAWKAKGDNFGVTLTPGDDLMAELIYNEPGTTEIQFIKKSNESLDEAKNKNYRVELYYYDNNKPDDVIYFKNIREAYDFCNRKISDNASYDDGLTGILVFNEAKDKLLNTWQNGSRGWSKKIKENESLDEALKPLSNYSSYKLTKLLTDKYYDLTMGHEDKTPFLNWFDRNFGVDNRDAAADIISNINTSREKRLNRDDLFYVRKYVNRVANLLKSSNVIESLNEAKNDIYYVVKFDSNDFMKIYPGVKDIYHSPLNGATLFDSEEIANFVCERKQDSIREEGLTPHIIKVRRLSVDKNEIVDESLDEAKNDTLNQDLWGEDKELLPEVREKLQLIADKFVEKLNEDEIPLEVKDIIIVGSNANYNYGPQSDIDLHIVADLSQFKGREKELAEKLYEAKKSIFNDKFDPMIRGHEVEIYVEPFEDRNENDIPDEVEVIEEFLNESTANSNGIYSLKTGWLKEPVRDDIPDDVNLEPELSELLNKANSCNSLEEIDNFIDDLYKLRQESILSEGEYGKGNLIFKHLRNEGILQNLKDKKIELENEEMSLPAKINEDDNFKLSHTL